jgi:hypothetical protein
MSIVHRVRPVLKVNRRNTSSVLSRAHAVNNGMSADPQRYITPSPSLLLLFGQIVKVEQAEQRVATRVKGTAAARDVERATLMSMLESELAYVQTLCDQSPDQAVAIAEGAGFDVASTGVHENPLLKATLGVASGSVVLDANATALAGKRSKRSCYNWQWSTDGGQTFHNAPSTPGGKTTIEGLPPLTMIGFRVSVSVIEGAGEWTPMVSILVH